MTTRHRRALWYGNPANQAKIADLLKCPVFTAAIELLFAEQRDDSLESGQIHSSEILLRRASEQNGAQRLLRGLERLSGPPTNVHELEGEWDQYDPSNNLIPTTNLDTP